MANVNLEAVAQVVTIIGGVAALLLAALEMVDTFLDIGHKWRKRHPSGKKSGRPK